MSEEIKKPGTGLNLGFIKGKIFGMLGDFIPEEFKAMVNDPRLVEPFIEEFFASMVDSMTVPYNHIRYSMYFDENKKMKYEITVWNPHHGKWVSIPFPVSRFLANLTNEEVRDKQMKALKDMIHYAYTNKPGESTDKLNQLQ